MSGFVLGTMCLVGLFCVAGSSRRHRRHCRNYSSHNDSANRTHRAVRRGFTVAAAEMVKRRLGVDSDQEDIVDHGLKDLFAAIREFRSILADSRPDFAAAFTDEVVDDGALDALFGVHDQELQRTRREIVSSLRQIHAVLTPEQRADAAAWLKEGRLM